VARGAAGGAEPAFQEASLMVSGSKMECHPRNAVKKDRLSVEGDLAILDLPLVPIANGSAAKLLALADVIMSHEGDIDFTQLHELCRQGRFKELQPPLAFKREPARGVDFGSNCRDGSAAFQLMMEELEGSQARPRTLKPQREKKTPLEQDERSEGHMFIREHGPRSSDRSNAKPIARWTLALKDFSWCFSSGVLQNMFGSLDQRGILRRGKSEVGKSSASKTIAYVCSTPCIQRKCTDEDAAFMTAKHMVQDRRWTLGLA
ncbi:unnamed protein product, partial [Prorocentrum cordatum]